MLRYFPNFRSALFGRHHHDTSSSAIHNNAYVILLLNVAALLNKKTLHFLALWTCLMGNQYLAQNFTCILTNLVQAFCDFDAASLPASACMNLGFDDGYC